MKIPTHSIAALTLTKSEETGSSVDESNVESSVIQDYSATYSYQPAMYTNEELIHYLSPLHANEEVIEQLYACLRQKDYRGIAACYHPDAEFHDGVLNVQGKQVAAMWHMLCETANDLLVQCYMWQADAAQGWADWEATYTFSGTGRKVHNLFYARFEFREGKIIRHRENFHFWRWASMALGTTGLLLGWTPLIRSQVRKTAAVNLRQFMEKHPQYE